MIIISGGNDVKATPLTISNRQVKLHSAKGTAGEALWESRSLPDIFIFDLFRGSSMVEHSAVNRRVGGSSPLHGAILFFEFILYQGSFSGFYASLIFCAME